MNFKITLLAWLLCSLFPSLVAAQTAAKKRAAVVVATPAAKSNNAKVSIANPPSATRVPSSTSSPAAAKNDPNHAVEIRGQSRTLSMMLVLKNGKENINFIKIRKDYNPEISGTQY